jgi:hypothetical protein
MDSIYHGTKLLDRPIQVRHLFAPGVSVNLREKKIV